MKHLFAFGCSNTYGDALPGFKPDHYSNPLAWPGVLAAMLDIGHVNLGISGNSNIRILNQILTHSWTGNELVTIMWSYFNREHTFLSEDQYHPIHDIGSEEYKNWLMLYDRFAYGYKSWMYIHHADLYLKSKNVPVYHRVVDMSLNKPYHLEIDNLTVEHITFLDYASDNEHPGIKTHISIAEKFYAEITNAN
jgi:hypothetical protein